MRRAATALAVTLAIALTGCSSSSSDHSGAEQACKLLDSYETTYADYSDSLTYLGDNLISKNIQQVQAMADASSKNSYDDLTTDFNALAVQAKSDRGQIFNVDYAMKLDNARNNCISHGYVVRAPAS